MKKVLIITYYWPPSAGSGVQRWVKFAKYLPEFGWEPIIFTPENPDFPVRDETLVKDIASDLEVIKFPIWEPYHIFNAIAGKKNKAKDSSKKGNSSFLDKLAIFIRGNVFIPDPRVFWVRPSVKFLEEVIRANHIDVIVTTGPPHSMHLVGLKLKKKLGINWVADFRDPWSNWLILKSMKVSSLAMGIHKKLEKKVLTEADMVVTVSKNLKAEFESFMDKKKAVEVVTNGYDEADFAFGKEVGQSEKFRISHIGTIDSLRNPVNFLEAVKLLCAKDSGLRNDLEIYFIGNIEEEYLKDFFDDEALKHTIKIIPYLSHEEILKEYQFSSVLLLLLSNFDNAAGFLPGKLFEYLAARRPILGVVPATGEAALVIKEAGAGEVGDIDNVKDIADKLLVLYQQHKRKETHVNANIEIFSRKKLTQKLAGILDKSLGQQGDN